MTVTVLENVIGIEGIARVEDAEALIAALQTLPARPVDLSACADLHAAVLQALLVYRPPLLGVAESPALAEWLPSLLDSHSSTEAER